MLSLSELSSVCSRLTNIQLLSVGKGRGIHQMLQLNIGKDDLNYGLSLCSLMNITAWRVSCNSYICMVVYHEHIYIHCENSDVAKPAS